LSGVEEELDERRSGCWFVAEVERRIFTCCEERSANGEYYYRFDLFNKHQIITAISLSFLAIFQKLDNLHHDSME